MEEASSHRLIRLRHAIFSCAMCAGVLYRTGLCFGGPVAVAVTAIPLKTSAPLALKPAPASQPWKPPGLISCADLPRGPLTEEQLKKLVPDNSPGVVRVKWATESQDETYGFNIMRADTPEGAYHQLNLSIIPGEGSTNIPHSYCYEDKSVKRGAVYYYQIEEVSNNGLKTVIDGTQATRVKVKSVAEERLWLQKKAQSGEK